MTSSRSDVGGLDFDAAIGRHRPPGRDVRLVVEGRDEDLVARPKGRPDGAADVEREGRHVGAELDLVGRRGSEEVGDGRMRLGRHLVGRLTGRERAAGVRVHVAVVAGDGVDHPLRDLRATGSVEEDHRPAVLLPGECRELAPQGVDIEGGHRDSGLAGSRGAYRMRSVLAGLLRSEAQRSDRRTPGERSSTRFHGQDPRLSVGLGVSPRILSIARDETSARDP